eukprot:5338384-Alexandrium_andersonii.AAC.1
MKNRKMVDQGGECSRELVLVLRRKAARLRVRDPGQADSAEPVPESELQGHGGSGRSKRGRGGGKSSDDKFGLLPTQPWGVAMDSSGW